MRGAVAIGTNRRDVLRLAIRCARDSMPPLRLAIIDDVAQHPGSTPTEVRKRLEKPRATVDRQLQALHILGVVDLEEIETTVFGKTQTHWHYTLAEDIDPSALSPEKLIDTSFLSEESEKEEDKNTDTSRVVTHISGAGDDDPLFASGATCDVCRREMFAQSSIERGLCERCYLAPHRGDQPDTTNDEDAA